MPSDEMTSVSSPPSPPRPSSVFSGESSDDDKSTTISSGIQSEVGILNPNAATLADKSIHSIPASLEHHRNQMDPCSAWVQNISNPWIQKTWNQWIQNIPTQRGLPETHPTSICLQLLERAVFLLCEFQESVGIESSSLSRFTVGIINGDEEIMEETIGICFTTKIEFNGELPVERISEQFDGDKALVMRNMIFGDAVLLRTVVEMRKHCYDSEHMPLLPIELRYAAATVYFDFFECCVKMFVQRYLENTKRPEEVVGKEDPEKIVTLDPVVTHWLSRSLRPPQS
ncbi:hypothetical protein FMUND_2111 [Fusarium mundagurra]|uniref:Uncharacterized protein n=1 Tax=Fusarium mundagurra TaxID=1567541 RepID=A0A8H6DPT2_9HYPO|nr:hypothetical protein FMUND_2111 [Fusarium mundagurra]